MSPVRHALLLALLVCCASLFVSGSSLPTVNSPSRFVNTEITRQIDMRTHIEEVTIQIKAKNLGPSSTNSYILALPSVKAARLAFLEATANKRQLLSRAVSLPASAVAESAAAAFFQIDLPKTVAAGETIQFQVFLAFTRTQRPFPESIEQHENQLVLWEDSSILFSLYPTTSEETTVRLASKTIENYTKKSAKKTSDEIKYGPFADSTPFSSSPISIHFVNNAPFVTFNSLEKDIEVSHWGNVAVQDNYVLTHTGAKLKGPFTRFDYERSRFGESAPASFRTLVGELPPTAKDIYYRDVIGNVSTSHVRRARDHTRVEVDPRFPMFGGWESDFHLGYNLPSQHYLSVDDSDSNHYVLNISFASPFASAAIDDLAVRVILPEGASSIEWRTPFDIDSAEFTEFKTYLDTTGRPTLILRKANCVRFHQQHFQVSYRFSKVSILREPLLIASATMLCLLIVIAFTHADLRITDHNDRSASSVRASRLTTRRQGTDLGDAVQTVLENLLAEPNGLLSAAQSRQNEQQTLVGTLVKEITAATRAIESEDAAFAPVASSIVDSLASLQKASKKYVNASGADVSSARSHLAAVVQQIQGQAEKLANL